MRDLINENNKNVKHSLDKIVDEDCFLEYENKYYLECTSGTDSVRVCNLFDRLNNEEKYYWEPFEKPSWFSSDAVVISDNISLEGAQIKILANYEISVDSSDGEWLSDSDLSSYEEWSFDEELFAQHFASLFSDACNTSVE